jgi:GT2 family glycosyltransferase
MAYKFPVVSIITVNFNGLDLTVDLLRSIGELEYPNIEVIVVDNASEVDPTAYLNSLYPKVRIIRSKRNLGFAGGNNLGMQEATGEYYFFVNNDTELSPDIINGLLETFRIYPNAGVVSPKFHYYFYPNTIEYAGYKRVNPWNGRNRMIGCHEEDRGQYNLTAETSYAHGGGMIVPAWVVKEIGPMPEVYFLYYEEFDWCDQIKRRGYKVYYQPDSLIYHKESMTTGKRSILKTYYLTRNRILFMRRNGTMLSKLVFFLYLACFTVPKNTTYFILHREVDHLIAFWRALWWNITKPSS